MWIKKEEGWIEEEKGIMDIEIGFSLLEILKFRMYSSESFESPGWCLFLLFPTPFRCLRQLSFHADFKLRGLSR